MFLILECHIHFNAFSVGSLKAVLYEPSVRQYVQPPFFKLLDLALFLADDDSPDCLIQPFLLPFQKGGLLFVIRIFDLLLNLPDTLASVEFYQFVHADGCNLIYADQHGLSTFPLLRIMLDKVFRYGIKPF